MSRFPRALLTRPFAHRGLHAPDGPPENSRPAIAAAAAAGYGVELDVRLSADGEAMAIHDATLDRTTAGAGPVHAHSAAALGATPLTGAAEGVPRLAEALEAVAGRTPVLVELKAPPMDAPHPPGRLEARVAEILRGYRGAAAAMSFDPDVMVRLRRIAPAILRGLVADRFADRADLPPERRLALAELRAVDAAGADFVSYDWRALPTPETTRLRAAGLPLICWTVRSAADAARARERADQITFEGFRPAPLGL